MTIFSTNMSKLIEVIDSLNDEMTVAEVRETLKAEAAAQEKANSQLYQRAKKAEGFEYDKNAGKWLKREENKQPSPTNTQTDKPGELDNSQKALLVAYGVKGEKALKLAEEYLASGRYTIDSLVENKFFKNELKELTDEQAAKAALPSSHRGSGGGSAKDSVDYWLQKGEMPPIDNPKLRQEYVNARYNKEKGGLPFVK